MRIERGVSVPSVQRGIQVFGGEIMGRFERGFVSGLWQTRGAYEIRSRKAVLSQPLFPAAFNPFGTIGIDRIRIPVAAKIALPTAGASATRGVSPAPAEGRSLRSSNTVSSCGASANRGTL